MSARFPIYPVLVKLVAISTTLFQSKKTKPWLARKNKMVMYTTGMSKWEKTAPVHLRRRIRKTYKFRHCLFISKGSIMWPCMFITHVGTT